MRVIWSVCPYDGVRANPQTDSRSWTRSWLAVCFQAQHHFGQSGLGKPDVSYPSEALPLRSARTRTRSAKASLLMTAYVVSDLEHMSQIISAPPGDPHAGNPTSSFRWARAPKRCRLRR